MASKIKKARAVGILRGTVPDWCAAGFGFGYGDYGSGIGDGSGYSYYGDGDGYVNNKER